MKPLFKVFHLCHPMNGNTCDVSLLRQILRQRSVPTRKMEDQFRVDPVCGTIGMGLPHKCI